MGRTRREATIRETDAASHFTALYSGLLGRDNWILVESARSRIPSRITIRKSDGRALIDACSPIEIPFATFAALVAEKLVRYAGRDGARGDIYTPVAAGQGVPGSGWRLTSGAALSFAG